MSIDFLLSADPWFWGLFLGTVIIFIWSYFSIRKMPQVRLLIIIRVGLLAILLVSLFQPRITRRYVRTEPLKWNIYLDNSISMGYHQAYSLPTLNTGINEVLKTLEEKGVILERYHFAGNISSVSLNQNLDAKGSSTDLGMILKTLNDEERSNLAGAILFTDGQPTQGLNPIQLASDVKVPVYVVGVGETTPLVDVAIHSLNAPTVAIKGEDVEVAVVVTATGTLDERLNVSLYKDKEMIGSRFIRVSGNGAQTDVRFRFKPDDLGQIKYRVQVSSLEDEINVQNNRQTFQITLLKDRYNIALLTGTPNFNTPVIKRIIKSQPRVQMSHFVQYGNSFRPSIKSFWETSYDLIVLDNYPIQTLSQQWQRIFAKKVMSQKSALAWIVGPGVESASAETLFPFFRLRFLEATIEEDQFYSWSFTEQVNELPFLSRGDLLWDALDQSDLPPVKPGLQVDGSVAGVRSVAVLSSTLDVPMLLLGEVESLRTAVWTTPDLYSLYYKLTGTHQTELVMNLWSGIMAWLMRTLGDNDMYFRLDKDSYQQGELISVMGNRIGESSPISQAAITLMRDGKTVNSTELRYNPAYQRWEGRLWASVPGEYEYEIVYQDENTSSTQTGMFDIEESQIELNNVFLNKALLQQITDQTGGAFFPWTSRTNLIDTIQPGWVEHHEIKQVEPTSKWWLLIIVILLLTIEWSLRRRLGLS